jgi:protoporphyrin/coproporphyrin ferrochelatase
VLHLFILPFRPRRLVHAYRKVWGPDGSPLQAISREQCGRLGAALEGQAIVELAMTYGEPSVDAGIGRLEQAGARRILVLPLYPQYSATSTAAVFDALYAALGRRRWMPEIRTIGSYHDDPGYIEAVARSIEAHWRDHGRGDHLLISFHSIPRRYVEAGDPYFCQCQKTARLLMQRLALDETGCSVTFQSRLGRQPWLMPYTDVVVPQLATRGVRTLDVVCPGFAADCLETLEEVAIRYAEDFTGAGGTALRYIPALNTQPAHIEALAALCRRHLQGWDRPAATGEAIERRLRRVEHLRPSLDSPTRR